MTISLIALLWVSFFSVTNYPKWLDFRPFNCNICLSFWSAVLLTLFMHFLPEYEYLVYALLYGGVAAYIAVISKRILFKI